jgi:hypothetical protein
VQRLDEARCSMVHQQDKHSAAYSAMALARPSLLSASRFVVGSSNARMPQLTQNDSASAKRMTREART